MPAVKNKKAETPSHNLTAHLIAHFLEGIGHKVKLEDDFEDYIADVFDRTTGLAYEVQTKSDPKAEKSKLDRALLHGEIKDVVFIHTKDFPIQPIMNTFWYKQLKKKITG